MNRNWMSKVVVPLVILAVISVAASSSFEPEVKILDKKEIAQLVDEQLINTYMDVVVELEASKTFHATSGFTPKDYKIYKDLLKFRMYLLIEIHSRNLELPRFDQ